MAIEAKYLKAGFHFFFRPDEIKDSNGDLISNTSKGFIDLGVCTALTPAIDKTTTELNDTRGGQLTRVARAVSQINETYTGTFADFNKRNIPLIFGAARTDVNSRSAIDRTTTHENFGQYIQLNDTLFLGTASDVDAVGSFKVTETTVAVYSKNATTDVATSLTTITWVKDTHYEVDDLLGAVKIIDYPSNHADTHSIAVAYSGVSIATTDTTYFVIDPQSAGGIIEGRVRLEIGSNSNLERLIRIGRAALNTSTVEFTAEDYSTYQMEFSILNDGSVGSGVGKLFNLE